MTKLLIGFNFVLVVVITAFWVLVPTSPLWFFASNSEVVMVLRLVLLATIVAYSLVPSARSTITRNLMLALGGVLIYLGIAGLLPTDTIGLHNYFPQLLDVFLSIQGGIICILCAIELPVTAKTEPFDKLLSRMYIYINALAGYKPAQNRLTKTSSARFAVKAR